MPKTIPARPTKRDGIIMRAQAVIMADSWDRMQYAKQVYDFQNAAGRDAIDRMQSVLIRLSRKSFWIGKGRERILAEIPKDAIWNNALYMAVEMMKDLAYMDIRVADFTWPPDLCMECGKPLRPVKKGRK